MAQKNLLEYTLSPLTAPSTTSPVFIQSIKGISSTWSVAVFPNTITSLVTASYIRKPNNVEWSGTSVAGILLFNSGNSQDFELHESDEAKLVIKILLYSGLSIKQADVAQLADAKETKQIQQEKS